MRGPRPRRALKPPLYVRAARVLVPTLAIGVLTTGVAVAAWPTDDSVLASPAAPAAAPALNITDDRSERTARSSTGIRPPLQEAGSAAQAKQAAKKKQPKKKQAKKKQAKKQQKRQRTTATPSRTVSKPATQQRVEAPVARATRPSAPARPRAVIGKRYATVALNVRTQPDSSSRLVTVLRAGTRLSITSATSDGWREISLSGKSRWVKDRYLSSRKPARAARRTSSSSSVSSSACPSGSAVESGLTQDAIRVHRALCARFPQVSSYGGVRPDSLPDHPSGRALDAMVSSTGLGWDIANWVRANRSRLGVSEVIFAQKIWTVQRGSEGWRSMSDRGSASANHYDHVHITVYGNAGSG